MLACGRSRVSGVLTCSTCSGMGVPLPLARLDREQLSGLPGWELLNAPQGLQYCAQASLMAVHTMWDIRNATWWPWEARARTVLLHRSFLVLQTRNPGCCPILGPRIRSSKPINTSVEAVGAGTRQQQQPGLSTQPRVPRACREGSGCACRLVVGCLVAKVGLAGLWRCSRSCATDSFDRRDRQALSAAHARSSASLTAAAMVRHAPFKAPSASPVSQHPPLGVRYVCPVRVQTLLCGLMMVPVPLAACTVAAYCCGAAAYCCSHTSRWVLLLCLNGTSIAYCSTNADTKC